MLHIITPVTFAPSLLFIEPVPLPAPQWNTSAPSYKCRSCRCEPLGAGWHTPHHVCWVDCVPALRRAVVGEPSYIMSDYGSGLTMNPNTPRLPRSPEGVSQGQVFQPQEADEPLGAKSLLLRFVLDRPPALVMPITIGDNENAKGLMDLCHRLAAQASFQLHVDMTDTLYYGEGGRVVEGETLEPPPLYSEPAAPEPAVISSSSTGKKRRCLDSPSLESFTPDSTAPPSLKAMRALLDYSLASFKQELKQELRQELKQAFDDSLAAYKQDVAEKLQETEACIVSTVRSEFNDHWADMEQSMMDRVREEMAEAQEDIM
ncbi:hypothetical protein LA080_007051 [Diaporthe eres]|nr:hypothetical protein LA080_007051 [Diaporthe eres]